MNLPKEIENLLGPWATADRNGVELKAVILSTIKEYIAKEIIGEKEQEVYEGGYMGAHDPQDDDIDKDAIARNNQRKEQLKKLQEDFE